MRELVLPTPRPVTKISNATYGPDVLTPAMAQHIGYGISRIAEAERHLEGLLRPFLSGPTMAVAALMGEFRGHKKLFNILRICYAESGDDAAANTLGAIWPKMSKIWERRDQLAHAVWVSSPEEPNAALKLSPKTHGKASMVAQKAMIDGDIQAFFDAWQIEDAEVWTEAEFQAFSDCAEGAVNSLFMFASCASQGLQEDDWRYQLLQDQGLLSERPWKIQTPPTLQ